MENTNQELLLRPENKRYVIYPVEYNDIWDKYKHLNNAGELKAAILGL